MFRDKQVKVAKELSAIKPKEDDPKTEKKLKTPSPSNVTENPNA